MKYTPEDHEKVERIMRAAHDLAYMVGDGIKRQNQSNAQFMREIECMRVLLSECGYPMAIGKVHEKVDTMGLLR